MNSNDDSDLQIVCDWWDLLEPWLNRGDKGHLSESSIHLLKQMELAKQSGRWKKAWDLIERMKYLSDESKETYEIAEVRFKCARVAVEMGALKEAITLLQEAVGKYQPHRHNYPIVVWLLGCVNWILPGRQNEAILNWQRSLARFEELVNSFTANKNDEEWYSIRHKGMKDALVKSIEGEEITPPILLRQLLGQAPKNTEPISAPDLNRSASTPGPQQPNPPSRLDVLQLYKIIEEIPAGGFGPTGFDNSVKGLVEVDQFTICGKPHRMVRLKNTGRIASWKSDGYYVAKVTGDSMDREGIDKGDYVLLRQQVTADDQDIVAAVIVGFETSATLKRFIRRKGEIILKPNSTNPVHPEMVFSENDSGFEIHGVAVAVFKPI